MLATLLLAFVAAVADESKTDTRPGLAPDIREDETALKAQRGNLVVVPIPISNPTLDTGLVAGAAYFYPQSEAQKNQQPASLTAAAGMYTSNDSRAFAIAQQNYWKDDRWRFTGAFGAADLRLSLLAPDETGQGASVDWRIDGKFLFTKLSRRLKGDWYGGAFARVIDARQSINAAVADDTSEFEIGNVASVGVGLVGFAGTGYVSDSFSGVGEHEPIASYGGGVRFVVLPAKRINIRLDFARSNESDAIHFSVGEAF